MSTSDKTPKPDKTSKVDKAPKKDSRPSALFFTTVNRESALAISKASAGAGVTGLLGFLGLLILATPFFLAENFFISMLLLSIALLVYVSGAEVAKLLLSSITIFFSSRHLIFKAAFLQETLLPIMNFLETRRSSGEGETFGALETAPVLSLPDNPLSRDLQVILEKKKDMDYAEYIAHAYFVECRELYEYSSAHLEFVSNAMPLFGLIGTVLGLIGMFDNLSANASVEYLTPQLALALKTTLYGAVFACFYKILASRFDQRLKALDYDFETFCRALQVIVESRTRIEVQ